MRMADCFTIKENTGSEYVSLFPRSKMENVYCEIEECKFSKTEIVTIEVPPSSETKQTIIAPITKMQSISPFYVKWVNQSAQQYPQQLQSYNTISQIHLEEGKVIITRLGSAPSTLIQLDLIFREGVKNEQE